jgi:GT2 family glycosyltransferase
MADLAVIIVSTNEAHWLEPCLSTVFAHSGGIELDVVVADNSSTDGTPDLVRERFPEARVVTCPNRGFGHANNCGYLTTDAPFVLFLNPDTEIVEGTFARLLDHMRQHRDVGVLGARQVMADGTLFPTIRRFPTPLRLVGEALASEKLPMHPAWLGERELDMTAYDRETECDWVSGSFMLIRREALDTAGIFDERFFVYSEEVDLCYRIKKAGWRVVHVPTMTIIHHADKAGFSLRVWSQGAFARRQYVTKHFGPAGRAVALGAYTVRFGLRAILPGLQGGDGAARRKAARAALATLHGHRPPPFIAPPDQALWPRREG